MIRDLQLTFDGTDYFPFLKLPLELRITVYSLILETGRLKTYVCAWPMVWEFSFISSICRDTSTADQPLRIIDPSLFVVSKSLRAEVNNVFYQKNIFRFSSCQIGTLLLNPTLLSSMRHIEIEDAMPAQRRWDMKTMLNRLHALGAMREIVIGAVMSGNCHDDLYDIENRPLEEWHTRYRQLEDKPTAATDVKGSCSTYQEMCNMFDERPVALINRNADFFSIVGMVQVGFRLSPLEGNTPLQPREFVYRMVELPKVSFINFKCRAAWEKVQRDAANTNKRLNK